MVTHISKTPEETFQLGADLGRTLKHGDVVGLIGDLGFGKTQFVKGIAQSLGITARVHSPTFTLVNEYASSVNRLYHIDLYRLETVDQIFSAGLEQYVIDPDGITVVEWFDHWKPPLPAPGRGWVIHFNAPSEHTRELIYENIGA
ncbi:MAG: tRNA (adenosine(37)-N6)-threonylcarbamoyltransferase complex ATPase subunit type 1 TsaE [Verrucomicrobiota bacterium]